MGSELQVPALAFLILVFYAPTDSLDALCLPQERLWVLTPSLGVPLF